MANDEHLAILKQGIEAWNRWREENPEVRPDLSEADLSGADLSPTWTGTEILSADLREADLSGANLSRANLNGANLSDADLSGAFLSEADLSDADLSGANLSGATLIGANLTWASLFGANLSGADLSSANLTGAHLLGADLSDTDQSRTNIPNEEHLAILKQGVEAWNRWRGDNPDVTPNLVGADLSGAALRLVNLSNARLSGAILNKADLEFAQLFQAELSLADLSGANLYHANLIMAILRGANLSGAFIARAELGQARLHDANLSGADLQWAKMGEASMWRADLSGANLRWADLQWAHLNHAVLRGANMRGALLINTYLDGADLTGSKIHGISAWDLSLENTTQKDLIISKPDAPVITVDNLEVAQFIYLILNNAKIRDVIESITSKGVLILGRFADPQRKEVLDGLREKLRDFNLLPIVFDFERPADKDYTETIQTLAGMSMFVIADVTNPKSTPLELEATVKQFKIPYLPIIDVSVDPSPFAMMVDLQKSFHWVLPTLEYRSKEELLDEDNLQKYIIDRAIEKINELKMMKSRQPETISITKKLPPV